MIHKISENIKYDKLIKPQDVASATTTTCEVWYELSKYDRGMVICQAYLTNTKTAVCTLLQASDASGTGSTTVSACAVTLTGTGSHEIGVIDFDAFDLYDADSTKMFVGVQMVTNQDGDDISACLLRGGASYKQATLPS